MARATVTFRNCCKRGPTIVSGYFKWRLSKQPKTCSRVVEATLSVFVLLSPATVTYLRRSFWQRQRASALTYMSTHESRESRDQSEASPFPWTPSLGAMMQPEEFHEVSLSSDSYHLFFFPLGGSSVANPGNPPGRHRVFRVWFC